MMLMLKLVTVNYSYWDAVNINITQTVLYQGMSTFGKPEMLLNKKKIKLNLKIL